MNLERKAYELRRDTLDIIKEGKAGHIGGDFSVMDILTLLYYEVMNIDPQNPHDPDRDRFVLSKGHTADALWVILADKGFFPKEELKTYSKFGSHLIGHPNKEVPGVEANSGSLGHGLAVCTGMAIAGKMDRKNYRVYTVMGDGELAEGSVWEAAMAAAHYKLDNLCAVVDRNRLQISGNTSDVMSTEILEDKFASFGWNVITVTDGNNISELRKAFTDAEAYKGKPTVLIADTVKGKGVSFMEGKAGWHHKVPNQEEYIAARNELEKEIEAR